MDAVQRAVNYVQNQFKAGKRMQLAITIVKCPFENTIQENDVDAVVTELKKLGYECDEPFTTIYNEKIIVFNKKNLVVDEMISLCCKHGRFTEKYDGDVWYINFNNKMELIQVSSTKEVGGGIEWHRQKEKLYVWSYNSKTKKESWTDVRKLNGDVQQALLKWTKKAVK